jgi:hypothetical protein
MSHNTAWNTIILLRDGRTYFGGLVSSRITDGILQDELIRVRLTAVGILPVARGGCAPGQARFTPLPDPDTHS